jgi:hypothetical protein
LAYIKHKEGYTDGTDVEEVELRRRAVRLRLTAQAVIPMMSVPKIRCFLFVICFSLYCGSKIYGLFRINGGRAHIQISKVK